MLSREEIKKWLLDNCVDCNGDLNLSDLDFNDFEGDIFINHWKVKHNMWFQKHEVDSDLWQGHQVVQGDLNQSWQIVMNELNQYHQEVQGDLYQFDQFVLGDYVSCEKKEVIKNVD